MEISEENCYKKIKKLKLFRISFRLLIEKQSMEI